MRGLVEPFVPHPSPWASNGDEPVPTKPPAFIREQARTAGRLLLEEEDLLAQIRELRGRPKKAHTLRRLERRLYGARGMRIKIEKLLHDRARRRNGR
jgi:hypothetical protein